MLIKWAGEPKHQGGRHWQLQPYLWKTLAVTFLGIFIPAIGWCVHGKYLDEDSSLKHLPHSNLFLCCENNMTNGESWPTECSVVSRTIKHTYQFIYAVSKSM